jgi:hypothetical protein
MPGMVRKQSSRRNRELKAMPGIQSTALRAFAGRRNRYWIRNLKSMLLPYGIGSTRSPVMVHITEKTVEAVLLNCTNGNFPLPISQ